MRVTSRSRRTLDDACYLSQLWMCDPFAICVLSLPLTAGRAQMPFTSFCSGKGTEVYVKICVGRIRGMCVGRQDDFACARGAPIARQHMLSSSHL